MSLQSINDFCSEKNLSGVLTFEYAPVDWIDEASYEQVISDANNWQYNIFFSQGTWLTAGVQANPRKKLWSESQRSNPQGPSWEQTVSGTTPKVRPEITDQFDQMAHRRFILKVTDLNGQPWLLGTLDEPFEFTAPSTTGDNGAPNQYNISFRSITSRRAHGYVPIL